MALKLKPVQEQTIVITGASSGIGLCTARMAARRGAKVVLCSRNSEALEQICEEIRREGGKAEFLAADVADPEAMIMLADLAKERFGGFDTWVNDAGHSIYGKLTDVTLEEKRRVFETNFWGVVHGCRAAVPHLRHKGGTIINLGSEVSERAIPLQGIYSATKHAVKAYTDVLRMELEHDHAPISVTLVKPAAIGTPFAEHARNKLEDGQPALPSPIYTPEAVAKAILDSAEYPRREIYVGGQGRFISMLSKIAPRMTDLYMEKSMFKEQKRPLGSAPQKDSLMGPPSGEGQERGQFDTRLHSSVYTAAVRNPKTSTALIIAAGAAFGAGLYFLSRNKRVLASASALWMARKSGKAAGAARDVGHRVGHFIYDAPSRFLGA